MPVNGGKVRDGASVETGMPIEIKRESDDDVENPDVFFGGESYRCYRIASRAVKLAHAEDVLATKAKEYDDANRKYQEAHRTPCPPDWSGTTEEMWKLVLRMREIRGVDPPVLTSADLRGAVVDLLRMEIHAFDVALEQAREDGASS